MALPVVRLEGQAEAVAGPDLYVGVAIVAVKEEEAPGVGLDSSISRRNASTWDAATRHVVQVDGRAAVLGGVPGAGRSSRIVYENPAAWRCSAAALHSRAVDAEAGYGWTASAVPPVTKPPPQLLVPGHNWHNPSEMACPDGRASDCDGAATPWEQLPETTPQCTLSPV